MCQSPSDIFITLWVITLKMLFYGVKVTLASQSLVFKNCEVLWDYYKIYLHTSMGGICYTYLFNMFAGEFITMGDFYILRWPDMGDMFKIKHF